MNCNIKNIDAGDTIMTACLEYEEYTVSISLNYSTFLVTINTIIINYTQKEMNFYGTFELKVKFGIFSQGV